MLLKRKQKKTVSFLVSGRGSNFHAVAKEILKGKINANIGIVISNKEDAGAIKIAKKLKLNNKVIPSSYYSNRADHEEEILKELKNNNTELIILAGYMRVLSSHFIKVFRNRIINIHPSLLPAFPGKNAQQQALDYGVKFTGCTCHYVDEGVDTGKIINQSIVHVDKNENISSLSKKILKEEHKTLIKTVKQICSD